MYDYDGLSKVKFICKLKLIYQYSTDAKASSILQYFTFRIWILDNQQVCQVSLAIVVLFVALLSSITSILRYMDVSFARVLFKCRLKRQQYFVVSQALKTVMPLYFYNLVQMPSRLNMACLVFTRSFGLLFKVHLQLDKTFDKPQSESFNNFSTHAT